MKMKGGETKISIRFASPPHLPPSVESVTLPLGLHTNPNHVWKSFVPPLLYKVQNLGQTLAAGEGRSHFINGDMKAQIGETMG